MLRPAIVTSLILFFFAFITKAQDTDTTSFSDTDYLIALSLDDLLKVKIVSASREEEDSFDVPNSAFVITGEEITLMGATSIPDALKICPGLIVREVSNGNYDVSIRGGVDGFPVYNYTYTNTTILVMIDNRPVFSSLQGGTFWQNLPIGLTEIDRIEVVNGPSSPLYGPNAVSGVINIITKQFNEVKTYASGILQTDFNNPIGSAQVAEKFNEKFAIDFAINYENRTRSSTDFYNPDTEEYEPVDSIRENASAEELDARYLDRTKSLFRFSGGFTFHYTPKEDIYLSLNLTRNNAIALSPLTTQTTLSNYTNNNQSAFIQGNIKNLSFSASSLKGTQGLTGALSNNKYNYKNIDSYIDYSFNFLKDKLSIKPAFSYQSAEVDDREFTINANRNGTFDGQGKLENLATSLKIDIKPIKQLRLISAIRYDKFNYPKKGLLSWQGIINYKIKNNHLFRFVAGSSYNGSFLVPILINNTNSISTNTDLIIRGNKELELLNNTSFELGYRSKLSKSSTFDISFFQQSFNNFNHPILQTPEFNPSTGKINLIYETENLDLKVKQQGVTVALQANLISSKIQIRPHLTIQSTKTENYTPYYNLKGAFDQPGYTLEGHIDTSYTLTEKFTPSIWGGFNLIVKPNNNLFFNLSLYYYDRYSLHMGSEASFLNGEIENQKGSNIKSKYQVNLNTTYNFTDTFSLFLNGRNIFNQGSPEGFGSDYLSRLVLIGAKINH